MYIHRSKNRKQVISKAIAKYGIENFEVYVEYLPSFTKDELLVLEQYTTEKMDSLCPNGYNVCPVGRSHPNRKGISRPTRTKDWCENLSKSLKGRIISDETKQKMSASRMGKQLSDETKSKISLKHKGRKRSPESSQKSKENHPKRRPVLQYTMDGEFVAEYMSLYDAARATGGIATNISETCKGRYNSCVGFIWKFKI
jgi:group I intron endonuclease